ncbi:MAG: NAD(P)/FAD-dependent oxidoreductase [Desulfovibrionales bacterium]|nr:NAD(P)/FAD-dependent oxidoreductase [Desulfovibrionales bacterium]
MKKLLILGSGCGGTMIAAKMRKLLSEKEWDITIIDKDPMHHYQPGWLFVPFGIYTPKDCIKPKAEFIPKGVTFVLDTITNIDPKNRVVTTKEGSYDYDFIVIGTGARVVPEEVEGMMDDWHGDIHDFYTPDGAAALMPKLHGFTKGKLILNIAETPYKCPVAPLEFLYMADDFFKKRGVRHNIELELVTPLTGAFTKSVANNILGGLCKEKDINIVPNFVLDSVDTKNKTLVDVMGEERNYDLLVSIPPNFGQQVLEDSGIGDAMCFVPTDNYTLKAEEHDNMYVIGDATNVPTSKAGSVAHFECDIICENLLAEINGGEPHHTFDGHSNCFIVTSLEKASLIDFNYETEPLPGKFPLPGIGPFDLLGDTRMNYYGKQMFRWVYYNLMLKGHELPFEPNMYMAGKIDVRNKK